MDSSSNNSRGATEILNAIVERLRAVELAPAGVKAFGRVELFDIADWKAAVQRLIINENRAAIVVYNGDTFNATRETTVLTVDRLTSINVMFTDRLLGDQVKALTGDAARPGTLGLLEAVLPAVTGIILEAEAGKENAVFVVPEKVDTVFVTDEEKASFPGRSALLLSLQTAAPWLQTAVGYQSNY